MTNHTPPVTLHSIRAKTPAFMPKMRESLKRKKNSGRENGVVYRHPYHPHPSPRPPSSSKSKTSSPTPHFVQLERGTQLSGIRQDVFLDRYSLKDESTKPLENFPEQMWRRVAWGLSQIESTPQKRQEWENKFYQILADFKFVPAGRILSGSGTGYQVTFYNCFVIPSPADSREGIMDNITKTVEIQARGGGVGINLSSLRPRGARVKKVNGTSSGPVNWASLYSTANHDVIQQGGSRRGALMLMLNDWHPDVEEFVTVKEDLTKIPGANLSVCISDAFMAAVKSDADWPLVFPDLDAPDYDNVWDGDIAKWQSLGKKLKVYRTIKARHLWHRIAQAAWRCGEPGIMFIDRYNRLSNTWYFEKIIATNPCVTGDTLISTDQGLLRIKELVGKSNTQLLTFSQLDHAPYRLPAHICKTGRKPIYLLLTKEGYELKLTTDHQVMTTKGWVKAASLMPGDQIYLSDRQGGFGRTGSRQLGQILGWLVGDGTFNGITAVLSFFGREKHTLAPHFAHLVSQLANQDVPRIYPVKATYIKNRDEARVSSDRLCRLVKQFGLLRGEKLKVPEIIFTGSQSAQAGFLQALFTADGHVAGNPLKGISVRLTSISLSLLKDVQRLLLNFGIVSCIYTNRRVAGDRLLPDGKDGLSSYPCKTYHELIISKDQLQKFAAHIGFLTETKNRKLQTTLAAYTRGPHKTYYTATFQSLIPLGQDTVYDITEPASHSFIANGLIVHNCGEQGLGAWAVCNLGSMNLSAYVKGKHIDLAALTQDVKVAVRLLDNTIDANYYFFDQIRKTQMSTRRIGLGTMGLADALIKMEIRYGSDESLALIDQIYSTIRDAAYQASVDIAKEKGPFGKFNKDKYLKSHFVKQLPSRIKHNIAQHGIRNALLLSQAPTGTISILAGTSSGIEPIFEFAFKRTDRTGEHIVYHDLYQNWLATHPHQSPPDYFVSARDLTPEEHVKVQAAIQKYTDSSISKTVNAPEAHTSQDVERLYALAYQLGCKGIAYFRENSRQAVLTSLKEKDKTETDAPVTNGKVVTERPLKVEGATYKIETPLGYAFVTVNHTSEGNPFEVFINIGKAGSEVAAMAEALGRLISTTLRFANHVPGINKVKEIVAQLQGIGGSRSVGFGPNRVRSLPDAVAKAMAMHFGLLGSITPPPEPPSSTQTSLNLGSRASPSETLNPQIKSEPSETLLESQSQGDGQIHLIPQPRTDICPQCNEPALVYEEGCKKCHACGYSEC